MATRRPVADMSGAELTELISNLAPGEMRGILTYLAGYAPDAFDRALALAADPRYAPEGDES